MWRTRLILLGGSIVGTAGGLFVIPSDMVLWRLAAGLLFVELALRDARRVYASGTGIWPDLNRARFVLILFLFALNAVRAAHFAAAERPDAPLHAVLNAAFSLLLVIPVSELLVFLTRRAVRRAQRDAAGHRARTPIAHG